MNEDAKRLADALDIKLSLQTAKLSAEYFYQSLPFCIIDAIFSLSVNYGQVRNVTDFFSRVTGWKIYRQHDSAFPEKPHQNTVSELVALFEGTQSPEIDLFNNRCYLRPSSEQYRVLKANVVHDFGCVLSREGIETFQDLEERLNPDELLQLLQSSLPVLKDSVGIPYFQMLAGNENEVKPDRMIHGFIKDALGKTLTNGMATELVQRACEILKAIYPSLTPRLLDNEIWKYQREQHKKSKTGKCVQPVQ